MSTFFDDMAELVGLMRLLAGDFKPTGPGGVQDLLIRGAEAIAVLADLDGRAGASIGNLDMMRSRLDALGEQLCGHLDLPWRRDDMDLADLVERLAACAGDPIAGELIIVSDDLRDCAAAWRQGYAKAVKDYKFRIESWRCHANSLVDQLEQRKGLGAEGLIFALRFARKAMAETEQLPGLSAVVRQALQREVRRADAALTAAGRGTFDV